MTNEEDDDDGDEDECGLFPPPPDVQLAVGVTGQSSSVEAGVLLRTAHSVLESDNTYSE